MCLHRHPERGVRRVVVKDDDLEPGPVERHPGKVVERRHDDRRWLVMRGDVDREPGPVAGRRLIHAPRGAPHGVAQKAEGRLCREDAAAEDRGKARRHDRQQGCQGKYRECRHRAWIRRQVPPGPVSPWVS